MTTLHHLGLLNSSRQQQQQKKKKETKFNVWKGRNLYLKRLNNCIGHLWVSISELVIDCVRVR